MYSCAEERLFLAKRRRIINNQIKKGCVSMDDADEDAITKITRYIRYDVFK